MTIPNAIAIVLAAFNYSHDNHDVPNPIKGLKKPPSQPRLQSLKVDEEKALFEAGDQAFRDFLFALIHTGLRPFCELATITADDLEELPRGMMWRVYSSKTKKTRKIPIMPEVAKLFRTLTATAPKGSGIPLFCSTRGLPWTRVNGVTRFIEAKRKLGWDQPPLSSLHSTAVRGDASFVHDNLK